MSNDIFVAPHSCPICGQKRVSLEAMEKHMLIHPPIPNSPSDTSHLQREELPAAEYQALRKAAYDTFGFYEGERKLRNFLRGKYIVLT